MLTAHLDALNILSTPIWVVTPKNQELLFANKEARKIAGDCQLPLMRNGRFSAHAQQQLDAYLPALVGDDQIVEIWTIECEGNAFPLSCRLSLAQLETYGDVIVFEGLYISEKVLTQPGVGQLCSTSYRRDEMGFYEQFFNTNTAPMLLIDPSKEGQIVDANQAAIRFYGYSRDEMCMKHTWEINTMGRDVLPVMNEVAKLPGGHKPLNFIHKLADGNIRHVQTYAGPVELDGIRLMLCIIHDITEQKRLEQALEHAALRDPLTDLGNRRQFFPLVEQAHAQSQRYGHHFSLILLDVDHFKSINDQLGHHKGDEVLILLARTLESIIRESDSVFRWGGEEFAILLPLTNLEGALQVAESIRETIQMICQPNLPQLTVSLGVAQHQIGEDTDSLFKRMDEALYRAKASGRNRVLAA
ncbi:sensor domain-containing diguanylate cyclase [Yersinia enterocolitica]|jgi:diguanylate cyclase (GGDEF)-like protein/PAS domain S-box-containing protein|uniref:diguanylate cyclase n=1 Tax=Yersinia massiliensis TaxID=419257 RepID=A0ABM6UPX8_9GAMM|nr:MULTISPECIES: sensor domain-containing diguanylate cyclase [Yersinia]AVX36983.1 sensor domain-containing diguanylate cyclase [Yersinia massiliensis]QKJ11787.1 GGDEF domain-containing protein [Yersinia massiliensis]CQH45765.1 diguanylate cyclase [Yersinia frederiksenii]HEI6966648.1 GGDEF domain-containing protein [Yersinia enterocolitica]